MARVKPIVSAGIIAVGSELLTPSKVDTNSLFITEQLNLLGIDVKVKAVVGDDRAELEGMSSRSSITSPDRRPTVLRSSASLTSMSSLEKRRDRSAMI
jgi:hypothetical protein